MLIRRRCSSYVRLKFEFASRLLYQAAPEIVCSVETSSLGYPQYSEGTACQIRGSASSANIELFCSWLLQAGGRG
jgi:hypothetical protein